MLSNGTGPSNSPFASIEDAIHDFRAGKMVVIVDSEDRENEGDIAVAAEFCTPELINFMATHARGLICLTLSPEKTDKLGLNLMAPKSGSPYETAFTISIEAAEGVSTGISAADRAHTVRVAARPDAVASDFIHPGHIFPLRAKPGGVLERTGQTEGSVDMCKLSGLEPAAVICEIMNEDGTMARVPDLEAFCKTHDIKMISITDMIRYRRLSEKLVERVATASLPTSHGDFTAYAYESAVDGGEHVALVHGDLSKVEIPLVRLHSKCITGDVFGSLRCDCHLQIQESLEQLAKADAGVLIYMDHEGRGIGLANKLRAYQLQDGGMDTVDANTALGFAPDNREFDLGAQILTDLGVTKVNLLTNNPVKVSELEACGVKVVERRSLETEATGHNREYLKTKRDRFGHLLTQLDSSAHTVGSAH